MKTKLLSNCCKAPTKVDQSGEGTGFYFCTKCVKGCDVTGERTGFGSKPSTLSTVHKVTGEAALLKKLIKERGPWSQIGGGDLVPEGHEKWHWQIFHILGKGEYPELRLEPSNVILATWQEQDDWTKRKHTLRDKPEWKWVFDQEEAMKLAIRTNDRKKAYTVAS